MDKKPLANTNRHLRNTAAYRKALLTNVSSSTAIETGDRVADISRNLAKDLADEMVISRGRCRRNNLSLLGQQCQPT
jgi:hypothetical protein